MKIVSWHDWLEKYIPYYEIDRQRSRFLDNPPEVILIINPIDRVETNRSPFLSFTHSSMNEF